VLMRWQGALLVYVGLVLAGGRSVRPPAGPSIEFRQVPRAQPGGSERMATIEGRVTGAGPGQRIVLYARSGDWFVQPFADRPFTAIQPDTTWRSSTHLGTEYAALLVGPDYRPAATTAARPAIGAGVAAVAIVDGEPEFWRTRWFQLSVAAALGASGWWLHRRRVRQITRQLDLRSQERLAERTHIAQELYDTLLQGFLSASMQLHLAIDQFPEGSPEKRRLHDVLRMMGQVTDEGRNVLQGLRSSDRQGERLDAALARIPHELRISPEVQYRVAVAGAARRLHPIIRDEVYGVAREAVVNAFRHAQARGIDVEIAYSAKALRLVVRDDGRGIDAGILASRAVGPCGLPGMRERAGRIGAKLRVRSRPGAGTEVELSVPGGIAFQDSRSPMPPRERCE
jgi:signal transduction histidine kinase